MVFQQPWLVLWSRLACSVCVQAGDAGSTSDLKHVHLMTEASEMLIVRADSKFWPFILPAGASTASP